VPDQEYYGHAADPIPGDLRDHIHRDSIRTHPIKVESARTRCR
jgi:hypothetical protein